MPALLEALNDDWIALPDGEALWRIERRAELVLPTLDRQFEGKGEKRLRYRLSDGAGGAPASPKAA